MVLILEKSILRFLYNYDSQRHAHSSLSALSDMLSDKFTVVKRIVVW